MAEACVRTLKRDDARASSLPDAKTVISLLPAWFEHDNARHPHRALGYLHPASSWRIVWLPKPESACPIREGLQQSNSRGVGWEYVHVCINGVSRVTVRKALRLKHIRTKPYTPKTNGKAERFIQTALKEWAYACPYPSSEHRKTSAILDAYV